MDYIKIEEEIEKKIPDKTILDRQYLIEIAMKTSPDFRETLFRNLLERLLKEGIVVRVGRNQYKKRTEEQKRKYIEINTLKKQSLWLK